jgi:hypothetical protein
MQSYGMTIFCDDIREELSGKISLIGVYGGDLVVNAPFPLWLPKICFLINAFFNPELTIKSPQLIIYFPGDAEDAPTVHADLPWNAEPVTGDPAFPDAQPSINFRAQLIMGAVSLREEGYIRVRITHKNERIRVGALKLISRPANETASQTA